MKQLFDNTYFQVVMMLLSAAQALYDARLGNDFWSYTMMVCTCWWVFRVWSGLRVQKHGEEQS